MRIDTKTGKLIIHQVDIDHIISWFTEGDNLQEAIERELFLHGLEKEWNFDAAKIEFDDINLDLIIKNKEVTVLQRLPFYIIRGGKYGYK